MPTSYDTAFYESHKNGSLESAHIVVPKLVSLLKPKSVLDVGCGIGTWLSVFEKEGLTDLLGLDGDYVSRESLKVSPTHFQATDLTKKFSVSRKYDLAISLEVGEHLPDSCADDFVASITSAADIVLFSAALPGQIGTSHINEQYPEYWAGKFAAKGYEVIDAFRKQFWKEPRVEWWYKQNMLLYVKKEAISSLPAILQEAYQETDLNFLTRIHPDMLNYFVGKFHQLSTTEGFLRSKLFPIKQAFRKKK